MTTKEIVGRRGLLKDPHLLDCPDCRFSNVLYPTVQFQEEKPWLKIICDCINEDEAVQGRMPYVAIEWNVIQTEKRFKKLEQAAKEKGE